MANKTVFIRPKLGDLLKINNDGDFHAFLFNEAINNYKKFSGLNEKNLGGVFALGTNQNEVVNLPKFNFDEIVLSNLKKPDEETFSMYERMGKDSRIKFSKDNMEKINKKSGSYDVVFCKETLHHIPHIHSGLCEMLRVCKKASVIIEPYSSLFGRIFEKLNMSSEYEGNPYANLKVRKAYGDGCYVYRWTSGELEKLLKSYYLESGYRLYIINFWLSSRMIHNFPPFLSKLLITFGWLSSFIPYNRGNFMIAVIFPGKSNPPERK